MARQYPNVTGQLGTYKTDGAGTDYVSVTLLDGVLTGMNTFPYTASSEDWSAGDEVTVRIEHDYKFYICNTVWDDTVGDTRLVITDFEAAHGGTIPYDATVSVIAVFSSTVLKAAVKELGRNFVAVGGVYVPVETHTFDLLEEHNGKTLCCTTNTVISLDSTYTDGFHCSVIAETGLATEIKPPPTGTLNGGTANVFLGGAFTAGYLYQRISERWIAIT